MIDHQLHFKPGAEGFGTWRLECLPNCDRPLMMERPAGVPCRCVEEGNDCENCTGEDPDHGACGFYGAVIEDVGPECQCDPQPDCCWVKEHFGEVGSECIEGEDWPENGPWPVEVDYDGGLILTYGGPVAS
jgi:hypothetical protein